MEFLTFAWPTSATNQPDVSSTAAKTLSKRAANLDAAALHRCAEASGFPDIERLGHKRRAYVPQSMRKRITSDAIAGRLYVESCLANMVTALTTLYDDPVHTFNLLLTFDGRRWWATGTQQGQPATPDNDRLGMFRVFAASGIADEPTDGPEFHDVQAVTAAVCVLDELAAEARKALESVGLTDEQRKAVDDALNTARLDVGAGARTIRSAFTAVASSR